MHGYASDWYAEAAFTRFKYDEYDPSGAPRGVQSIEDRANSGSFSLTAGYLFNDLYALEVGYTEFSEHVSDHSTHSIFLGGDSGESWIETDKIGGLHAEGVLRKRFGNFLPYVQLGLLFGDEVSPLAVAGLLWEASQSLAVNMYYEAYLNSARRRRELRTGVHSLNLGLRYSFH